MLSLLFRKGQHITLHYESFSHSQQ